MTKEFNGLDNRLACLIYVVPSNFLEFTFTSSVSLNFTFMIELSSLVSFC